MEKSERTILLKMEDKNKNSLCFWVETDKLYPSKSQAKISINDEIFIVQKFTSKKYSKNFVDLMNLTIKTGK